MVKGETDRTRGGERKKRERRKERKRKWKERERDEVTSGSCRTRGNEGGEHRVKGKEKTMEDMEGVEVRSVRGGSDQIQWREREEDKTDARVVKVEDEGRRVFQCFKIVPVSTDLSVHVRVRAVGSS